ncbi:MAG: lysozyme [Bacteriovoracales bacterium]
MKIEYADTEIIRSSEGFSTCAYLCSAGKPTISYGLCGPDITLGVVWTKEKCESEFMKRIDEYCVKLDRMLPSNITKNKYIACLSLAWNIGLGAFAASTLLKHLKLGDWGSSAECFLQWDKITVNGKKIMSKGLHERRKKEQALFLKG